MPGTTITSYSPVSRAIGVTCDSVDRRLVVDDRADHHHAAHHQRVRIALARAHELRKADRAAGATLVVDRHLLDDVAALQRRLQRTAGLVPAAARRRGHQDLQAVERDCRPARHQNKRGRRTCNPAAGAYNFPDETFQDLQAVQRCRGAARHQRQCGRHECESAPYTNQIAYQALHDSSDVVKLSQPQRTRLRAAPVCGAACVGRPMLPLILPLRHPRPGEV